MNTPTQPASPPAAREIGPVVALVALIFLAFAGPCIALGTADWSSVYVPAAHRLQTGEDLFQQGYVYPPFAALLALPSSLLSAKADRVWWWAVNSAAASVLILGAWRLAGGRFAFRPPWKELLAAVLGLMAAFGFTFDVVVTRQTDLILGALIVGAGLLVARERFVLAAVLIGLAAAAKCTPLLFVPYFALVGRWRAATVCAAVAVLANLLPDALFPPADSLRLLDWSERFLPGLANRNSDPGLWFSAIEFNHSLAGITNRLFTANLVWADGRWRPQFRTDPDRLSASTLKLAVLLVEFGLLAVAAVAIRRSRTPLHRFSPFDFGMVLTLMLLLSPMSSKPHFCTLVLPAWAVARAAIHRRDPVLMIVTALTAVLGLLPNKDLVGSRVYDFVLWYGTIPLESVLLFAGCAWARWRSS